MAAVGNDIAEITIKPTNAALGADVVGLDLNRPLSPDVLQYIQHAWSEHLVLRFRGMEKLDPEKLIEFSRYFGDLDMRPIASGSRSQFLEADHPELTIISNVVIDGKPIGGLGAYEADWHSDMTYVERPPKGSCLYAVEIPPQGGDTFFSNMFMAYDTLNESVKREIASLTCVHDASRTSAGELRQGFDEIDDPRKTTGPSHPLVRVHPVNGKKCLLLGRRRNAYINDYSLEDSEKLLNMLWSHATQAKFVWGQEWQLGDMIMWDNRCTMHRRESFDPSSRRVMLRTQISGEPVLAA